MFPFAVFSLLSFYCLPVKFLKKMHMRHSSAMLEWLGYERIVFLASLDFAYLCFYFLWSSDYFYACLLSGCAEIGHDAINKIILKLKTAPNCTVAKIDSMERMMYRFQRSRPSAQKERQRVNVTERGNI